MHIFALVSIDDALSVDGTLHVSYDNVTESTLDHCFNLLPQMTHSFATRDDNDRVMQNDC